jgi:hypothetical protein
MAAVCDKDSVSARVVVEEIDPQQTVHVDRQAALLLGFPDGCGPRGFIPPDIPRRKAPRSFEWLIPSLQGRMRPSCSTIAAAPTLS